MAMDEEQKKCGGITLGGLFTILVGGCLIGIGANYFVSGDVTEAEEPCMKCIPMAMIIGGCIFILSLVMRFVLQVKRDIYAVTSKGKMANVNLFEYLSRPSCGRYMSH